MAFVPRSSGARVSDEAARGWDRALATHGVNFAALMEALGLMLDERTDWLPDEAIERARLIRDERDRKR